jgi:hypothetical protein
MPKGLETRQPGELGASRKKGARGSLWRLKGADEIRGPLFCRRDPFSFVSLALPVSPLVAFQAFLCLPLLG